MKTASKPYSRHKMHSQLVIGEFANEKGGNRPEMFNLLP